MTMVSTGPISLGGNATSGGLNQSVNVELGLSPTATISMNDAAVRTLFGVGGSGTSISMSQGYGKANQFAFTISSNQTNANLRTLAVNAGWNQSTKVVATIASGVIISSNGTGTPALTVNGSFPGGVDLVNSGVIVGMGGNGGLGASSYFSPYNGQPGLAGGLALSVSTAVTITNNNTIAGGGGGGGGGGNFDSKAFQTAGGGGGGGGRSSAAANSAGGAGGPGGPYPSGSAGGAGTYSAAGGGGAGGIYSGAIAGTGGSGGGWGAAGATGGNAVGTSTFYTPGVGGAGGGAVSGNSNVTWVAFGTRLGAIT